MSKRLERLRTKLNRYRAVRLPRNFKQLKAVSRKPHAVPVITITLLIIITGGAYLLARSTNNLPPVHDAKIVIISHDKQQQVVPSKERTVGALLGKLGLKLNEGDVVEPAQTARINQDQFRINIYRAVPVEVVDGGNRTFAFSAAKTPRAIAQQAGTSLYPEDITTTEPVQDFLKTGAIGEQVIVDRATAINVDLYGTAVVLRTHAKTVGQLMQEKSIKLIKDDKVVPATDTPIAAGQQISFIRTGTKTETITENIAMPEQNINDPSLAYGTKAIRQQGSPGQQVVTYQVAITNNVETARTVIQKVVTKAPVTQVAVVGTSLSGIKGDMALAGIGPGDYNFADYIIGHESGWRPNAGSPGGPYGLCQAYPGGKMASAGSDWLTNPVTQLRWCNGYALARYGSWGAAYNHWLSSRNW
jgi:uncharacterized protein YabE (DUF348 family)